jgi:hypothetical protein
VALDDDPPLVRGERLARGQHPIQQRIQLLPGDLRVDLPDRTANDPRPIPEERPGGPIRADHHVLLAMEDEHAGRQFGHGPGEGDRIDRGHVGDHLAREFLRQRCSSRPRRHTTPPDQKDGDWRPIPATSRTERARAPDARTSRSTNRC